MWWWVAAAVLFLGVIPLVVVLANRLVKLVGEVRDYAEDIGAHIGEVTRNLEALPALAQTSTSMSSVVSQEGPLRRLLDGAR